MKPARFITPNPNIDPHTEEMMHSLLDGRAKYRYVSPEPAAQDKTRRAQITLATTCKPDPR